MSLSYTIVTSITVKDPERPGRVVRQVYWQVAAGPGDAGLVCHRVVEQERFRCLEGSASASPTPHSKASGPLHTRE